MLCATALATACKGSVVPRAPAPAQRGGDALLVLPGFGYSRAAEKAFRAAGRTLAAEGIALYVPNYVRRSGLAESRDELLKFYRAQRLDRYERLHVFAFIAGAWTLNPALAGGALPNVATIIYDRSPLQERAPRIAMDRLRLPTRLLYGRVVFDVARSSYTPVDPPGAKIGLLVETKPTSFVKRFAKRARAYGPFDFRCDAFGQRYDDCAYLAMNHDELYTRFPELVPEILAFIRTSRFRAGATRAPPTGDPLPLE